MRIELVGPVGDVAGALDALRLALPVDSIATTYPLRGGPADVHVRLDARPPVALPAPVAAMRAAVLERAVMDMAGRYGLSCLEQAVTAGTPAYERADRAASRQFTALSRLVAALRATTTATDPAMSCKEVPR